MGYRVSYESTKIYNWYVINIIINYIDSYILWVTYINEELDFETQMKIIKEEKELQRKLDIEDYECGI